MLRIAVVVCMAFALALVISAKGSVDFTNERFFRFGMSQADADEAIANEKDWKVLYRVDTTQTSTIACVYQEQVFYQLGFYQGRCYSLEKRAELPQAQVDPSFKYYLDKLGKTDELTSSSDEKLLFSRWTTKDREISLTGAAREDGIYMLTYEEKDPIAEMDAQHVMDEELQGGSQEVDPITGKLRPLAPKEGDENGEQAKPQDDGKKDGGKQDDGKKDNGKQDDGKKDSGGDSGSEGIEM
jgi:hypothetical protein